jgi:hypothetical protein
MSRRTFVRGGAGLALLSVTPVPLAHVLSAATPVPAPWSRSRFAPFRGSTFRMTGAGEDVDVVLTEINDLRPVLRVNDERRFALLFVASPSEAPANGIRTFGHDDFGDIALFVSPVGRVAGALRYQAIINRL